MAIVGVIVSIARSPRMIIALIFLAVAAIIVNTTGGQLKSAEPDGTNPFSRPVVVLGKSPVTSIAFKNIMPGDSIYGTVTVTNDGLLELRYAVTSLTTEDVLASQMEMTIWEEAVESTNDDICDHRLPLTVLYGPLSLGSVGTTNVVGNPLPGRQIGDRVLAPSDREVLCFRFELPITTGYAYQLLSTTATLTFSFEKTQNN